jgi:NAD(P)-dependent dehydrogenase (short-subunit alcohol dehydrogenase family)
MNKFLLLRKALLWGSAFYGARQALRSWRAFDFAGRVVLITGGSRGLGLILARLFSDEGARLVLLARDEEELARAKAELEQSGAQVLTIGCDVTDSESLGGAIEQAVAHYGALDVLINNAGAIAVGPMEHMSEKEFRGLMDLHCWATLDATRAALPHLKKNGGRVVNIASLGGLVAVPHLSAYNVSKFAVVGLSTSLRAELAKDGVLVTTICPGTMRTGSHINATMKGAHEKEYRLFALTTGLPFISANARVAAQHIVEACRHGDAMVIYPPLARAAHLTASLLPNLTADISGLITRLMPKPIGSEGDKTQEGWESRGDEPSVLTGLADEATNKNNQRRGHAPLPVPEVVSDAVDSLNK